MRDIIVTTPKSQMENAAAEAASVIRDGGGTYFRALHSRPEGVGPGSKLWYVEDGYVRGFATVTEVRPAGHRTCDTTGRQWSGACFVVADARTWKWVRPIPKRGFQGWEYFDAPADVQIVGGWRDPKPKAGATAAPVVPPPADRPGQLSLFA